jgi:hypothetical protein
MSTEKCTLCWYSSPSSKEKEIVIYEFRAFAAGQAYAKKSKNPKINSVSDCPKIIEHNLEIVKARFNCVGMCHNCTKRMARSFIYGVEHPK